MFTVGMVRYFWSVVDIVFTVGMVIGGQCVHSWYGDRYFWSVVDIVFIVGMVIDISGQWWPLCLQLVWW